MLKLVIPAAEYWDSSKNEFRTIKAAELSLEHSLISISKWEAKWKKPYLSRDKKTSEEMLDYIRCMTLSSDVDPAVYYRLNNEQINVISEYINDPMTATTFSEKGHSSRRIITSELIYCWMINLNIPVQFEKWHLNRLMTLIRVCGEENNPKKMNKKDIYNQNKSLNAARRARMHSKG